MNSKDKGSYGEHIVIADLLKRGFSVSVPVGDNARYDLVVDRGGSLLKLQVKTLRARDGKLEVPCCSKRYEAGINNRSALRAYTENEIDFLVAVDFETAKCYYIPSAEMNSGSITLRLEPSKNGQTRGVRLAEDYMSFDLVEPSR